MKRLLLYILLFSSATLFAQVQFPDNIIDTDCNKNEPSAFVKPQLLHYTSANINVYSQTLCGDINDDGIVDIVVAHFNDLGEDYRYRSNQLDIYNGNNLSLESTISIPQLIYLQYCTFALAKYPIANGEYQGCIVALCFDGKLRTYNINGQLLSTSDYSVPCEGTPTIADFNNDGFPEVYIGNAIFDLATLKRLCAGPANGNMGISYRGTNINASPGFRSLYAMPYAYDLFGDSKLELICGNTIYDVNIVSRVDPSQNSVTVNKTISLPSDVPSDGHVAIADLDLDGKMEILVTKDPTHDAISDNCHYYAYSPYTGEILFHKAIYCRSAAFPTIGNIDSNPNPEILFIDYQQNVSTKKMYCWRYSAERGFQELWSVPHYDNSGMTSLVLFDFNKDEIMEVVHRDQDNLRIMNCSGKSHITGNDTLQCYDLYSHIAVSSSFSEHAIIADVNNDGAAEIITTGLLQPSNLNANGSLLAFGHPEWPSARPVWNQYAYNMTNVNEDLTIPTLCFNNATAFTDPNGTIRRPFNNFLQQATYINQHGEPYNPGGVIEIDVYGEGCGLYIYHGTVYTESGVYEQFIESPNGCDTLATVHVNMVEDFFHSFTITACDSYIWNGNTYTQSGVYEQAFISQQGCDSIVQIQLTIKPSPFVGEIQGETHYYYTDFGEFDYFIEPVEGAYLYDWSIDNPDWTLSSSSQSPSCTLGIRSNGVGTLTLKVHSECGVSERHLVIHHDLLPDLIIFPNPTRADFTIRLWGMKGDCVIQIFDVTGRLIDTLKADAVVNGTDVPYSLKYKAGAMYLVRVVNNNHTVTRKVVKWEP